MRHSEDPDGRSPDDEREVIGKGFQIDATLVGTADAIRFRMIPQPPDRALDLSAESLPELRFRTLVIADGIQKLLLASCTNLTVIAQGVCQPRP